jgi:hypothetical protein
VRQQVARRPRDELDGPGWQDAGLVEDFHHSPRHEGGAGGGLHDDRDAGQKRAGSLLAEAPCREVERVDQDGHAFLGQKHVLTPPAPVAGQRNAVTVSHDLRVTQALAQVGVGSQGASGAVYVELGVGLGVTAIPHGHVEQLVAVLEERFGHGLEQRGTLAQRHGA